MGFETFLGNPEAVKEVRDMVAANRVPGALLLSGPDGVGKKTLALMLALAMNCQRRGPHGNDFCGQCPRCRKAEEMIASAREDLERRREIKDASRRAEGLVYFDIQVIEPITRFILIEQIRQLRSVAYSHPFEFERRVFVVDQTQAVHWQATDLLLKVLEEPPPTTTIILIAPNAHELRPTIRSRCRKIQFLPVDDGIIQKLFQELPGLNNSQQELGVRVADGSVTMAKEFNLADYQRRRKPWLDFLDAITARPPKSMGASEWRMIFDSTKALTVNREEFDETLKTGYTLLRDLMFVLLRGSDSGIANVDLVPKLKAWAPKLGLGGINKLKTGLDTAYRLQTHNVNQQLTLDALATEVPVHLQ